MCTSILISSITLVLLKSASQSSPADTPPPLQQLVDPSNSTAPCEDGLPYCEYVDDYPIYYIEQLMKLQPESILSYFNKPVEPWSVRDRALGGTELCRSRSRIIYPRWANATWSILDYIVNTQDLKQGVPVDECVHTNECDVIKGMKGLKSECLQKKTWRTLVVFNAKNNSGMVTKPFEFPSGCSCSAITVHER